MDENNDQEARGSTSISVKGDRIYVQKLKALAAIKGISLAKLTRLALDASYGEDLQGSFFVNDVASKQQMSNE